MVGLKPALRSVEVSMLASDGLLGIDHYLRGSFRLGRG